MEIIKDCCSTPYTYTPNMRTSHPTNPAVNGFLIFAKSIRTIFEPINKPERPNAVNKEINMETASVEVSVCPYPRI